MKALLKGTGWSRSVFLFNCASEIMPLIKLFRFDLDVNIEIAVLSQSERLAKGVLRCVSRLYAINHLI